MNPVATYGASGAAGTGQKLRDYLGGFGFRGDKVTEETQRFSGGEEKRVWCWR